MTEQLTDVDLLLLSRWQDAAGMNQAFEGLEERLADRLQTVAERVRPWIESRGYQMSGVDKKRASIDVIKKSWLKGKEEQFYVCVAELFPFGYRRVREEHPYVWLVIEDLPKDDRVPFQQELTNRLKSVDGGWINENCDETQPVGRDIPSYGDSERIQLARSEDLLEQFVRRELDPLLSLGDSIDAAFAAVVSAKRSRGKP